jgi:hypothetical protein
MSHSLIPTDCSTASAATQPTQLQDKLVTFPGATAMELVDLEAETALDLGKDMAVGMAQDSAKGWG